MSPHLPEVCQAERAGLGLPGGFVRNAHSLALFLEHEIQQNRVKPWYLHFNKGPDVFSADAWQTSLWVSLILRTFP